MVKMNPEVDFFFQSAGQWQEEYQELRTIMHACGLTEQLKWGVPCYTAGNKNIVLIHGFKSYCAILFFKGALLKDNKGILIRQSKNVQAARQIRFTEVREIVKQKPILKAYIREAIEVEKSGQKVRFRQTKEYDIPKEFKDKLEKMPALKKAFYALTPGRQRGYLLYFSSAKQSATRESRVKKYVNKILDGKGLND
jgi:uncharacterized protein YdeI (YjbR/CyaY-like superfamily)